MVNSVTEVTEGCILEVVFKSIKHQSFSHHFHRHSHRDAQVVMNTAPLGDEEVEIRPHSLSIHSYKTPTFCRSQQRRAHAQSYDDSCVCLFVVSLSVPCVGWVLWAALSCIDTAVATVVHNVLCSTKQRLAPPKMMFFWKKSEYMFKSTILQSYKPITLICPQSYKSWHADVCNCKTIEDPEKNNFVVNFFFFTAFAGRCFLGCSSRGWSVNTVDSTSTNDASSKSLMTAHRRKRG